jgi:nitroreductase
MGLERLTRGRPGRAAHGHYNTWRPRSKGKQRVARDGGDGPVGSLDTVTAMVSRYDTEFYNMKPDGTNALADAVDTILQRVSPAQLTGPAPSEAQRQTMLEAACRAPDHGRLQPWRFVLIDGAARERFGELLAQSLKRREPEASEARLAAERNKALRAPLIITAIATPRGDRIPAVEQILAMGAAIQNLTLAAYALGFGAFWRTGAPAYDTEVRRAFGLASDDVIAGFIYVGTIATPGRAREVSTAAVTTTW